MHDGWDDIRRRAAAEAGAGTFLGGPPGRFIEGGRMQVDILRAHGLRPHHSVVDIGAGPLRAGVCLMDYLDPGRYFALEPSKELFEAGKRIAGEQLLEKAALSVDHNDQFDLTVFGQRFDFGIARSIWTHASLRQIGQLLRSWAEGEHGILLASYLPTRWRPYRGDRWIGISHESAQPGLVRHRSSDICQLGAEVGLHIERVPGWRMGGQRWLRVSPSQS